MVLANAFPFSLSPFVSRQNYQERLTYPKTRIRERGLIKERPGVVNEASLKLAHNKSSFTVTILDDT